MPGDPQFIKRVRTPPGMRRVRANQYQIYEFIVKRYGGSITKAAKGIGMSTRYLNKVVNRGIFGNRTIDRIVSGFKKIDPSVSYETLFIPPKFVKIEEKEKPQYPAPIKPKIGNVQSFGTGLFSRVMERCR